MESTSEVLESQPTGSAERSALLRHGQKIGALVIWALVIAAYFAYAQRNDLSFVDVLRQIAGVLSNPLYGPVIYIVVYVLRPVLLFSAALLTIVGGSIFGPIAILYTVIGANGSALLAYGIGRFFGGDLIAESDGQSVLQRYAKRMRENSFETVFVMRLIFLPYDLVNYLSGFLRIDWKAFLLATILGSIAGTISFSLIGASLTLEQALTGDFSPNPWTLAISVAMFVVSVGISRWMKRREGITET